MFSPCILSLYHVISSHFSAIMCVVNETNLFPCSESASDTTQSDNGLQSDKWSGSGSDRWSGNESDSQVEVC